MQEEHQILIKESHGEFRRFLEKSYVEKKIVSFFTNEEETGKFSTGFIGGIFQKEIIINHITPCGHYDGYFVKRIDNILKVEFETLYTNKIEKLYRLRNSTHDKTEKVTDNGFLDIIIFSKENNKIISVELLESGVNNAVGYVESFSNEFVSIKQVNEYGDYDGLCLIKLDDITHLVCDSEEENSLDLLFFSKNK